VISHGNPTKPTRADGTDLRAATAKMGDRA
jgi:hypothetical protein